MPTLADIFAAIDSAKRDPGGAAVDYGRGAAMNIGGLLDLLSRMGSAGQGPGTDLRGAIGGQLGAQGTPVQNMGEMVGMPGIGQAAKLGLLGSVLKMPHPKLPTYAVEEMAASPELAAKFMPKEGPLDLAKIKDLLARMMPKAD